MRKQPREITCELCSLPAHQLFLCRVHWENVPRHLARAWQSLPAAGGSVAQRMAAALPILELIDAAKKRNKGTVANGRETPDAAKAKVQPAIVSTTSIPAAARSSKRFGRARQGGNCTEQVAAAG